MLLRPVPLEQPISSQLPTDWTLKKSDTLTTLTQMNMHRSSSDQSSNYTMTQMNRHLFIQRSVFIYRKKTNLKQNDCYSSKPRSNRLNCLCVFGASDIGYDADPDEHAFVPPTTSLQSYHPDPDEHAFVPPIISRQLYDTDLDERVSFIQQLVCS